MGRKKSKMIGPPLESLIKHLADCPPVFLRGLWPRDRDGIVTTAVFYDLLREITNWDESILQQRINALFVAENKNLRESQQVAAWLFFHPWFRKFARTIDMGEALLRLCSEDLPRLDPHVPSESLIRLEDRIEELARLALKKCGTTPEGESQSVAEDRLTAVSTLVREQLAEKTASRARAIRKAMAEKAAREAANVYGRE